MKYVMYYFTSFLPFTCKRKKGESTLLSLKNRSLFLITTFLIKLLDIKKKMFYTSGKKTKKG